jgi:hypothetical protein
MMITSMMVIFQEQGLVGKISCKGSSSNTEAGKRAFDEAIVSSEGASISPGFAVSFHVSN